MALSKTFKRALSNVKSQVKQIQSNVQKIKTNISKPIKKTFSPSVSVTKQRRAKLKSIFDKKKKKVIPKPSYRKMTVAVAVGNGRMQDAVVTLKDGKIQSTKKIGTSIPQSARFKAMGRDNKTTQQIVNNMTKKLNTLKNLPRVKDVRTSSTVTKIPQRIKKLSTSKSYVKKRPMPVAETVARSLGIKRPMPVAETVAVANFMKTHKSPQQRIAQGFKKELYQRRLQNPSSNAVVTQPGRFRDPHTGRIIEFDKGGWVTKGLDTKEPYGDRMVRPSLYLRADRVLYGALPKGETPYKVILDKTERVIDRPIPKEKVYPGPITTLPDGLITSNPLSRSLLTNKDILKVYGAKKFGDLPKVVQKQIRANQRLN